ncbi:MAG TPA: putative molybdenum carrier protein [Quisquiliibacterium sp.]|nr:putative molybdenum carrier protein [Quisquiliibacterium sp.]
MVSGGQTGVDRAALDVAIGLGLAHGGYRQRTRRSVADADARTFARDCDPQRDDRR